MKHIIFIGLAMIYLAGPCSNQVSAAETVDPNHALLQPIVLLNYIDHTSNGKIILKSMKVGFVIGNGTLILTADHCADDFLEPLPHATSRQIFVVSPYYGDIFPVQFLGRDQQADIALFQAAWDTHPAFALAESNDPQPGDKILIPSLPQFQDSEHHFNNQYLMEQLTIQKIDLDRSVDAIVMNQKEIQPGWSGSPLLLQNPVRVAGVTCLIQKWSTKKWFFFKKHSEHVTGPHVQSICDLIESLGLSHAAFDTPSQLPSITDGPEVMAFIHESFNALVSNQINQAVDAIESAAAARPHSAYLHMWLATVTSALPPSDELDSKTQEKQALSQLETALTLAPEDPHILAVAGQLNRNISKNQARQYNQAALELDPNNTLALYDQLLLLYTTEPNQAVQLGQRLTALDPNFAMAWHYTSEAFLYAHRAEEALASAQQSVALDPNGLIRKPLAHALKYLGRHKEAEQEFIFMTQHCGCDRCWRDYSEFLITSCQDRETDAQTALDEAKATSKKKGLRANSLNQIQFKIYIESDPNQAMALVNTWLEQDPNDAYAWWERAGLLRTQKQYEQAVESAQRAVDLNVKKSYQLRLADCLNKSGQHEQSLQIYQALVEAHPNRTSYWYYYARHLLNNNQADQALEAINHVPLSLNPFSSIKQKDLDQLRATIQQALSHEATLDVATEATENSES